MQSSVRRPGGAASYVRASVPVLITGMGIAAGAFGLWRPAYAGGQDAMTIFRGDTRQVSGITPGAWGSGVVTEDTQVVYNGSISYKIVTHGMFQGGDFALARAFDLGPYVANKSSYVELAIQPPPKDQTGRNTLGGGPGRGMPPGMMGMMGMMGGRGGRGGPGGGGPGGGGPGGRGQQGRGQAPKFQKVRPLENVRLVLVTTTGKAMEALLPLSSASDEGAWKLLHIPVASIPGIEAGDAQIKEFRVFGDVPGTMYLGALRIKQDATPISIQRQEEKVVPRNEKYRYTASAGGGSTPLVYSWDFDEADGIQDEKQGRSIVHAYRKVGDFTVTVTVSDLYGVKPPATLKFKVHVTP